MSLQKLNILPALIALLAAIGVLVHDTGVDQATAAAITMPMAAVGAAEASKLNPSDPHTHTERHPFSRIVAQQPAVQPRNENDKKYLIARRFMGDAFGSQYYWPN